VTGGDAPIQSRSLRKRRFMVLMCPRAVPSLFLLKQQRQTVTTILPTCSLHRTPLQSSVSTLGLCAILAHFQMSEDWMEIQRRLKTPKAYRSASTESVSKRARRHFYFFIRPPHKLLCAPRSPWIANTASLLETTYCEILAADMKCAIQRNTQKHQSDVCHQGRVKS